MTDTNADTIRGGVALLRASMTTLLHSERLKMADMIENIAAERDAARTVLRQIEELATDTPTADDAERALAAIYELCVATREGGQ